MRDGLEATTIDAKADLFVPVTMRGVLNGPADCNDRRHYYLFLFVSLRPGRDGPANIPRSRLRTRRVNAYIPGMRPCAPVWLGGVALLGVAPMSRAHAQAPDSLRIPILVYHSVMPHHAGQTHDQRVLDVDDSVFAKQMQYLANSGYRVIPFGSLVDALEGKATVPKRAVVVTFDDGWENQYRHAFPILRRFGLTATFFVFTAPIGTDEKTMTWEQLRELQAAGMTIGSHTRTHPVLPASHRALHNEVQLSREDIAQHLGRAPEFFAYPFGQWDEQSAAWARRAGYRAARAYRGGAWNSAADLYHLRAVPVTDDMQKFERAVSGGR